MTPSLWVGVVSKNTIMCWKWHPVIFSTCYFLRSTLSAGAVLTTHSARAVFDDTFSTRAVLATLSARTVVTFQHGAIWLVLPTTFSAGSHLIGTVSALTPLIGGQFCDFQHGGFSLVGIIATHHDNTGCIQVEGVCGRPTRKANCVEVLPPGELRLGPLRSSGRWR